MTALGALNTYGATIRDCHAVSSGFFAGDGGALAMVSAPLVISNSQVLNNVADVNGGAIYLNGAIHSIARSSIIDNRADITDTNSGGGIYAENGAAASGSNAVSSI